MTRYERGIEAATKAGLKIKEIPLDSDAKALIKGSKIALNSRKATTTKEKTCVLAEEVGHYYTAVGNILDQREAENRKQEQKGRLWAYNNLIGLNGIINAHRSGKVHSFEDMSEYFEVTIDFLMEALGRYRQKYGLCAEVDNYIIFFEPFAVMERMEL